MNDPNDFPIDYNPPNVMFWFKDGRLCNDQKEILSARTELYKNFTGIVIKDTTDKRLKGYKISYVTNGKFHRTDGPALINIENFQGVIVIYSHYSLNGKRYFRETNPRKICECGDHTRGDLCAKTQRLILKKTIVADHFLYDFLEINEIDRYLVPISGKWEEYKLSKFEQGLVDKLEAFSASFAVDQEGKMIIF